MKRLTAAAAAVVLAVSLLTSCGETDGKCETDAIGLVSAQERSSGGGGRGGSSGGGSRTGSGSKTSPHKKTSSGGGSGVHVDRDCDD